MSRLTVKGGRFLTLNTVIRVSQIEAARNLNEGVDEAAGQADREGNRALLESKTIVCDNAHAVLPLGTIDIPGQGGTASGAAYVNFGWALTPPPKMIPTDGSTITVWVDGLPLGHPSYGHYREDIATLFPEYANASGAIGYLNIDTTGYPNGAHTIAWSVEDSAGVLNGIGSRYFTIQNAGAAAVGEVEFERAGGFRPDAFSPVYIKKGYGREAISEAVFPDRDGVRRIGIRELERLAISLEKEIAEDGPDERSPRVPALPKKTKNLLATPETRRSAYLAAGGDLRALPIGSTFDAERGMFYWQSGPGFVGDYGFVFIDRARLNELRVTVRIEPQTRILSRRPAAVTISDSFRAVDAARQDSR